MAPWFYTNDIYGLPYSAIYIVEIILIGLNVLSFVVVKIMTSFHLTSVPDNVHWNRWFAFTFVNSAAIFVVVSLFDYVVLCSRMDYMLEHGKDYVHWETADGSFWPHETYVNHFINPSETDPVYQAASKVGCKFNLTGGEPGSSDTCKFLYFPLDGDLLARGYEKFSVGLGLIIFLIFQAVILMLIIWKSLQFFFEDHSFCAKVGLTLLFHVATALIGSQQSCVLMILSIMKANPYCAYFDIPPGATQHQMLCYYKYAVAALPYGIPLTMAGAFFAYLATKMDHPGAMLFCGIVALAALLPGVGLLAFWLLAGLGIGLWIHYGSFFNQRIFIIAEFVSPAGFSVVGFLTSFLGISAESLA